MLGWNATKNFSAASTTAKVEVVVEAPIEVPAVIPVSTHMDEAGCVRWPTAHGN